ALLNEEKEMIKSRRLSANFQLQTVFKGGGEGGCFNKEKGGKIIIIIYSTRLFSPIPHNNIF
ncbi:MAG: hypothetical protein KAW47_05365, partial [Thermoplasmatales archaeon]|nr:hypothetical protein [Thermoplasmatales archaeon]